MMIARKTAVLLAACVLPALLSCGEEETPAPEVIRPVRFIEVFATGAARTRTFAGSAQAAVESQLSFKVGGLVTDVHVRVGDDVKRGQPIAEIDASDYELQVQDSEASLAQARSQARNARATYERTQSLYEANNASRSDLDAALAAKESAEAQVGSIEKKLEMARLQLSYTELRAPSAGSIAAVDVEVNENVAAGKPIVTLTAGEQLEVEVAVPEILIADVREGDAASVQFDAIPDQTFPATVTEVGVTSGGFATTYPVKVRLGRTEARIRPGMAAEVSLSFGDADGSERYFVPAVAVAEDQQGRFVYVVVETENGVGVARRRPVSVGEITGRGLEITEGLSDGDRVVTAGVSRLHDGQKVRVDGGGSR